MAGNGADAEPEPTPKVTKVGDYEVLVGGHAIAFWPLVAGTTLTQATPPLVCAPNTPETVNTAFVPQFGIVDVVIRMTDEVADAHVDAPDLSVQVGGPATVRKAALVREKSGDVHITFAVDQSNVAEGEFWKGSLRLTAPQKDGATKTDRTMEVKLKVGRNARVAGLFIFFVVHQMPKKAYAWMKVKVVEAADGASPVSGAVVKLKVLRDNDPKNGFANINRRIDLTADEDGHLTYRADRYTLAMPVEWPLLLNAEAAGHVPRGHLIRIAQAESSKDQTKPFEPGAPIRMTAIAGASLAHKSFVLDPGHGVVYALKKQRRSQEWFVAHRLADRIAEILVSEHGVARDSILYTKTAGLGLIEPAQVHKGDDALKSGAARFRLDLPHRKIHTLLPAVRLDELSSLLITRHQGDADHAVDPPEAQRNAWLATNAAAINAIITRVNGQLAAQHHCVQANSVRWHTPTHRYVYTEELLHPPQGAPPVVHDHVPFPVAPTDEFLVDQAALDVLVDRTARWSLQCEVSGDGAFPARARVAMKAAGGLAYMRACIHKYADVAAPHPYVDPVSATNPNPEMAWTPTRRNRYFNNEGASADLILTLHENASRTGAGCAIIVAPVSSDSPPTDDQVRLGKIFLKYVDPFDRGLRQGGISPEDKAVTQLTGDNTRRDVYVYFEDEFMDSPDPDHAGHFQYEQMTTAAFIDRLARQIVCGVVEALLDKQADLDPIFYRDKINDLW